MLLCFVEGRPCNRWNWRLSRGDSWAKCWRSGEFLLIAVVNWAERHELKKESLSRKDSGTKILEKSQPIHISESTKDVSEQPFVRKLVWVGTMVQLPPPHPRQKYHQLELSRTDRVKWRKTAGHLRPYMTARESYLSANMPYSSRQGKGDSKVLQMIYQGCLLGFNRLDSSYLGLWGCDPA